MGSSRLPRKVLMNIDGENKLVDIVINKLQNLQNKIPIILATTNNSNDDELVSYIKNKYDSVFVFRGSENNVLSRFIEVSKMFSLTHVIRVCADNPLIDIEMLNNLVLSCMTFPMFDYYSYYFMGNPVIKTHFGVFTEIVSLSALIRVQNEFSSGTNNEHVTLGVYENSKSFCLLKIDITDWLLNYEGIRLTIDTKDDFENVKKIIHKHYNVIPTAELFKIIIKKRVIMNKMNKIINKNIK